MHLAVASGTLGLFVQAHFPGLFLDQFFELVEFVFVELAGDQITAVDPSAQVDQFAAIRAERKRRLIVQILKQEEFFADWACHRFVGHDLPDPPDGDDDDDDEPEPELPDEDEPLLAAGGGGAEDAESALAALL